MLDFFRRRKKYIAAAAAGAASAAAAYYWWSSANSTAQHKRELQLWDLLRQTEVPIHDDAHDDVHLHSPMANGAASDNEPEPSLDESMDSHFSYIQDVSTPLELDQLLPKLQATLFEMTDVQTELRGMQQASAADKLKALAKLSFARAVGTCWLIPIMDLYVRVKLNVIGRHLFLQEKLAKLRQPASTEGPVGLMPPKLTAAAVEAFLKCDFFAERGCRWLVGRVLDGVDKCLEGVSLEAECGPQEVVALLGSMMVAVEAQLGPLVNWPDVLVGSDAVNHINTQQAMAAGPEAYRKAMASASMVDELHEELHSTLSNHRFADAVRAAVQFTFRSVAAQAVSAFPREPATAVADSSSSLAIPSSSHSSSQTLQAAGAGAAGVGAHHSSTADGTGSSSSSSQPGVLTRISGLIGKEQPGGANEAPPMKNGSWLSLPSLGLGQVNMGSSGMLSGACPGSPVANKPPRPLARLLKMVQGTAEPTFGNIQKLTKGISGLAPVMALCASVFACSVPIHMCG